MTSLQKNSNQAASEQTQGNPLFPVFLKLNKLHTVLIGAGNIGLEKLNALVHNSPEAKVTVIARSFLPEIHLLAAEYGNVIIKQKSFAAADLDEANLVVAAT